MVVVVSLGSKGMFASRGTKESVFTATNGTNDYKERRTGTDELNERKSRESGNLGMEKREMTTFRNEGEMRTSGVTTESSVFI